MVTVCGGAPSFLNHRVAEILGDCKLMNEEIRWPIRFKEQKEDALLICGYLREIKNDIDAVIPAQVMEIIVGDMMTDWIKHCHLSLFLIGSTIKLHGLNKKEWNGKKGEIVGGRVVKNKEIRWPIKVRG